MLVSQVCIVHREENQECSLGVHRNGCGSGLKFLHWFLFQIGVHLGTISADWSSLRVEFFWFSIVALGAILYRMPGLHVKMRLNDLRRSCYWMGVARSCSTSWSWSLLCGEKTSERCSANSFPLLPFAHGPGGVEYLRIGRDDILVIPLFL